MFRKHLLAAGSAMAILTGIGLLASSAALAAPSAGAHPVTVVHPAAAAHPASMTPDDPNVPIVATGTYDCGIKGEPEMLGTIGWTPASGTPGIAVVKFYFWAHDCKVLSGKFKGQVINTVHVVAAFPIDPNTCPWLPAAGTYRENLFIDYPGVNFGVHLAPSYASVDVDPGAAWTFAKGLVGGSFANAAGVAARFRPILWVGSPCPSYMTLAQTSLNELLNF